MGHRERERDRERELESQKPVANGLTNGHSPVTSASSRSPTANGHSPVISGHSPPLSATRSRSRSPIAKSYRSNSHTSQPGSNYHTHRGPTPPADGGFIHLNGFRLQPAVVSMVAHFAEVRHQLKTAKTREEKASAITRFLDSLPPSLGAAARQHVLRQISLGQPVNIDELADYLAKLEVASALATPITSPSPPPNDRKHSAPLKLSPSKRITAPISAERETSEYVNFAPSRPSVHNLLLADSKGGGAIATPEGERPTIRMRSHDST